VADVCKPSHNPYSVAFTHLHPVRELLWRAYGPVLLAAASGESVKAGGVPAVLQDTPRASMEEAALAGLQADEKCLRTTKDCLYTKHCCTNALIYRRYAGLVVCEKCDWAHAWNVELKRLAESAAEAARAEMNAEETKWRDSFDLAAWPDQNQAEAWRTAWSATLVDKAHWCESAVKLAAVLASRRVQARLAAPPPM
jgi:hypothetical protein